MKSKTNYQSIGWLSHADAVLMAKLDAIAIADARCRWSHKVVGDVHDVGVSLGLNQDLNAERKAESKADSKLELQTD